VNVKKDPSLNLIKPVIIIPPVFQERIRLGIVLITLNNSPLKERLGFFVATSTSEALLEKAGFDWQKAGRSHRNIPHHVVASEGRGHTPRGNVIRI